MLITEAHVETERAGWYLTKLCEHFEHKSRVVPEVDYRGQAHPDMEAQVEWSEKLGTASFGWGRCSLSADSEALSLRAEAPDEERLRRVERLVGDHLERFGRSERLVVEWTPPERAIGQLSGAALTHVRGGHAHD